MLISPAPIAMPVNTANVPTEAVAAEAIQRPKIPQPTSAAESPGNKNTTEFAEQSKSSENNVQNGQNKNVSEKQDSEQEHQNSEQKESAEKRAIDEIEAEELKQIQSLVKRDREVRAHEQAHASVGGNLAGAPNLNYASGPDGKRYAVSGDVSIDVSKVPDDPAATIRKLEQVQRAALAPANPSSQDRKVAAQASASANQARSELNIKNLEKAREVERQATINKDEKAETSETQSTESESLATAEPGKAELRQTAVNSGRTGKTSLNSSDFINPVTARRQAAQLNQKIAGSGALSNSSSENRLYVTA